MPWLKIALVAALLLLGGAVHVSTDGKPAADPPKSEPAKPAPRRPILPIRPKFLPPAIEAASVGGQKSPDGTEEINCDLPKEFHLRNVGGTDGAGLCVWCSITHTAIWQHIWELMGTFQYMQSQRGGGWPERVDSVVPLLAKKAGVPTPPYIQVQSRNDYEILKLACKTGRMPCITYSYSPTGRYGGAKIAHMVSLVHATDKWVGILDNNFPGTIEWMDPQTFMNVHTNRGRENGWAVVFLADPPPPPPVNFRR